MLDATLAANPLTPHVVRELSVAVPCDPRTLLRALRGQRVQSTRLVAIRRTLASRGLLHLLTTAGEGSAL
jgi:hypothetical protein